MGGADGDRMTKWRIGKFYLACQTIWDRPEHVRTALRDCIVLDADRKWDTDRIEYLALHPAFDEIEMYSAAPEYNAVLHLNEDGSVERTFERAG